ncbi:MAG: B12-binding domain-containing radical SAM protein [Thermodesulfovibrionales bacterium]
MKKILLVNPNNVKPLVAPLALEYISSFLLDKGHDILIYDVNISKQSLSDVIEKESPNLVGISVRNIDDSCYVTSEFFLDGIKTMVAEVKAKGIPVILGGVGYSIMPFDTLAYTGADAGIYGEGEKGFENLFSSEGVPKGIIYASIFNLKEFKPRRGFISNLFYYQRGGMVGIETTRGCNRRCIYCADPVAKGRKVRFRSIESVVDEFTQLLEKGIAHYHLCDSEFNLSLEYTKSLCEAIINRGLGERIAWYAYGVPDLMDRELARLLRKAGCKGINFGIDHTESRMLSFLCKNYRFSDVKRTVGLCKDEGIKVMADLLLGAPGETFDSVKRVIEDMKILDPFRVGTSYGIRIYPRTPFYEYLKDAGFRFSSSLLQPIFYLSDEVKDGIDEFIKELIKGDERFYFNARGEVSQNYNYNANKVLEDAISEGHRGAFWDILANIKIDKEIQKVNLR